MPSVERVTNGVQNPDTSGMMALLYQKGGFYIQRMKKDFIRSEEAVEALSSLLILTHYSLPSQYDFVNRFRTGEMPIGIRIVHFNVLCICPEIRGLWEFSLVPGTKKRMEL